jgi:hypothetical protein
VPGYVLFGAFVVLMTAPRRYQPLPTDRLVAAADDDPAASRHHFYRGLTKRTWVALGALLLAGVADIGETILFRTSLIRLTHGDVDVSALAFWTRVLTGVKWSAAVAATAIVIIDIVFRRSRSPGVALRRQRTVVSTS